MRFTLWLVLYGGGSSGAMAPVLAWSLSVSRGSWVGRPLMWWSLSLSLGYSCLFT